MAMSRNIQLGDQEKSQVYFDADSGRILGFGPLGARPSIPAGWRYRTHVCLHAWEIERYAKQYREQMLRDEEQATLRSLEKEAPFRNAIRESILQRNRELESSGDPSDRRNIRINEALLKVQDTYYQWAKEARSKAEICVTAEKFEAGKTAVEIGDELAARKGFTRG
jgi:hypothetical protein